VTPPLDAWNLSGTPIALPGGHRNTVLRVGDYVVKTSRRSEDALRWLAPAQDIARAAGLHTPRLIESTSGPLRVDGWTCVPYLPGTPTEPAQIADRIARMHARSHALPQRPGFASARDLRTDTDGSDIDLTDMPTDLVARIRHAWAAVADRPIAAVHGDLNPSNILTQPDGTHVLIDWDEAHQNLTLFDTGTWDASDPVVVRARQAWEIACSWQIEPEHAQALAQLFTD